MSIGSPDPIIWSVESYVWVIRPEQELAFYFSKFQLLILSKNIPRVGRFAGQVNRVATPDHISPTLGGLNFYSSAAPFVELAAVHHSRVRRPV
ncbi:MAG: hypothetical protein ACQETE_00005 [Bacteroidota bacterium]